MTYNEWLASVPPELTNDPLWRMEVYRLAVFAGDLAWHDVSKLVEDKRTISLSDQLYRAIGSVSANATHHYPCRAWLQAERRTSILRCGPDRPAR